jgi:hypothetical protein
MALVLKTSVSSRAPWVRIPPSPFRLSLVGYYLEVVAATRLVSCGILANREFSIKNSTTIGQLVELSTKMTPAINKVLASTSLL